MVERFGTSPAPGFSRPLRSGCIHGNCIFVRRNVSALRVSHTCMNSKPHSSQPVPLSLDRRSFLKLTSAGAAGLMLEGTATAAETRPSQARGGKWVFDHRVQFGAWINDMR